MTPNITPHFGVKFLSRQERTVRRVTKNETRHIQKRLQTQPATNVETEKKVRVRPAAKPKAAKPVPPPSASSTPAERKPSVPRLKVPNMRRAWPVPKPESERSKKTRAELQAPRTLQRCDLEKLARLNCSREFSLFHQYIKSQLPRSFENQVAFLLTKLHHLKNEFVNRQAEHLNFEQIREYYNQAVEDQKRKQLKADEFLTLSEKIRVDIKEAIEKWLRKKELKPKPQVTINSQRRQERIRERIKATIEEQKRQQQEQYAKGNGGSESMVSSQSGTSSSVITKPAEITLDDDDEIMIIE